MPELEFTNNEMIEKKDHKIKRYPNLNTVLMVEDFLKKNRDIPIKITELKKKIAKTDYAPDITDNIRISFQKRKNYIRP